MVRTVKVTIVVYDKQLLEWAKLFAKRRGTSLGKILEERLGELKEAENGSSRNN